MNAARLRSPAEEAVADWLLTAALWDEARAREEWRTQGITLLECGRAFCALRVPVALVEAIAPRAEPATVDLFLADALHQAPAIRCNGGRWFYVLVTPGVSEWWDRRSDVHCLGPGHDLGVPRPDLVGHPGHTASYWAVPLLEPGRLGSGEAVSQMASYARFRMTQQEGTS